MKNYISRVILFIFSVMFLSLYSCQQNEGNIERIWYKSGLPVTENHYFSELQWKTQKTLMQNDTLKGAGDLKLFEKLSINREQTFMQQLFDLDTGKPFEKPVKGTWKKNGDTLYLQASGSNEQLLSKYLVTKITQNEMYTKFLFEQVFQNGKITKERDFPKIEKKFQKVVREIGYHPFDLNAKNEEYMQDYWDVNHFGKYLTLSRLKSRNQLNEGKFSSEVYDLIYGYFWDYIPLYDPTSELTHFRLTFNQKNQLDFSFQNWQALNIQSEPGCGTPPEANLSGIWNADFNKKEVTLEIKHSKEFASETKRLLQSKNTGNLRYRILAVNEHVMIWEKVNE